MFQVFHGNETKKLDICNQYPEEYATLMYVTRDSSKSLSSDHSTGRRSSVQRIGGPAMLHWSL